MTTAQALGSLLKSARDIMRKDKGLNGDLDRLPLLTWIMFLKFLDDLEHAARGGGRSSPARSSGRPSSRPIAGAIGRPIRKASRATSCSPSSIRTKRVRPDGKKGPGLFAYLRALYQLQRRQPPRRDRHRVSAASITA